MSAITCRQCGARSSDGDRFWFIEYADASFTTEIVGVNDNGSVRLDTWGDPFHSPLVGRDEIRCDSCDHQWRTTRSNPADLAAPETPKGDEA